MAGLKTANETSRISRLPPCRDGRLAASCAEYKETLPCCPIASAISKPKKDALRQRGKVLWGRADCVDLFSLKGEILEGGRFDFRAVSWCMFPVIQRGDRLKVEEADFDSIRVGDIPVYKSGDKLFAHRIVDKKVIDGKPYLITRPDGSAAGEDNKHGEAIPAGELLGRITEVKRFRESLSTQKRQATRRDHLAYRISEIRARIRRRALAAAVRFMDKIQSSRFYRTITKAIFRLIIKSTRFYLVAPVGEKSEFYNHQTLDKLSLVTDFGDHGVFMLLVKVWGRPAGYTTFLVRPASCAFKGSAVVETYVRLRYRGLGLEDILVGRVKKLLEEVL